MGKYTDAHERYVRESEWLKKPFREMTDTEKTKYIVTCILAFGVMLMCAFAPVG